MTPHLYFLQLIVWIFTLQIGSAYANDLISDPVAAMRQKGNASNQTYTKWEADINGDGKNEIFVCNKLDYDEAIAEPEAAASAPPGWFVFFPNQTGLAYTESVGVKEPNPNDPSAAWEIGATSPAINPLQCFVGQVSEVGRSGIVSQRVDRRDDGTSTAYIFVYTIEGDHLVETKIAEYDPDNAGEGGNPIYNKYLKEDKRTAITVTHVPPP